MKNLVKAFEAAADIRSLAARAARELSSSLTAREIAKRRTERPIDYMRYAEFEAILRDLELYPRMTVLDVSSPQWFSLYLASKHPTIEFYYINIIESELIAYGEIAKALRLKNLKLQKGDVRNLNFPDNTFDRVISISVLEHVYPEDGGDLQSLTEIRRVLKSSGELLLTVPFKSECNVVYVTGPVYERNGEGRNFYAREYDEQTFNRLVELSRFAAVDSWFICERRGLFALDYYQWGPGKAVLGTKYVIKAKRLLDRVLRRSFDDILAERYLYVSRTSGDRLVNISCRLRKV
jgi:ubiquinone/menaquinone biosynthesis C-methylase UbiE